MDFRRSWFLSRYYASNAIRGKLGGLIVSRSIEAHASRWEALRQRLGGGEEVLVVGNGPSLAAEDLSALSHIPSIASNKIYLIFDQTAWRPTYYSIADPLLVYKLRKHDFSDFSEVLCPTYVTKVLQSARTLPWKPMAFAEAKARQGSGALQVGPTTGIFGGHTVTVTNIQLALWLGARKIYLIGCDHSYREPVHERGRVKVRSDATNHFTAGYRDAGEIVNNAPIGLMDDAFELVNSVALDMDAQIVNISRQSALSMFPRRSVEDVVASGHEIGGSEARGI